MSNQQLIFFVISIIILFFYMTNIFEIYKSYSGSTLLCGIALLLMFALYGTFIFFYVTIIKDQQELANRNLEIQMLEANRDFSKQIMSSYEENKRLKHDLYHHLIVLRGKLNNNSDLEKYLNSILDVSETSDLIQSNNKTLNNVVNYYAMKMLDNDIRFEYQIQNTLSFIEDNDIAVILGNLLVNAIEAQNFVKDGRNIRLTILEDIGVYTLYLENTCDSSKVIQKGSHLLSSKENPTLHGYGLSSVQAVVNKYHGNCETVIENSMFKVIIIFQI